MEKLALVALSAVTIVLVSTLSAWPVMVALGILSETYDAVPRLTFWETFWIVWAWGVIWNRVKFSSE